MMKNSFRQNNSRKMEWPDSDAFLPAPDRNRLFYPEIVYESPYTFDVVKKRLLDKSECGPYEGYDLSLIDANRFPYANGKRADCYFYKSPAGIIKMLDLSEIIQFKKQSNDKMFWLIPTANKEFDSRGCNLYTNLSTRDLSIAEDFAKQLERMVIAILDEQNQLINFDTCSSM